MLKNSITQKVDCKVDDLDHKLVAQRNDLIKSVADMTRRSIKIFEIAVSALDTTKQAQRNVQINKKLIFDILNQQGNSKNSRLRKALKELQHNAVFHLIDTTGNEILISPISKIEWNEHDSYINIVFSPEILPYITFLKENFTQYKLENIAKFRSKHSITLYKLLSMYYNQYNYYDNSNRTTKQLDHYKNPTISLKELRYMTNTSHQYTTFSQFRINVLDKAVQEINQQTELSVNYDNIRSGRTITHIQFHISKKCADADAENLKHLGTVYQTQQAKQLEKAQQYTDAMQSPYTQMLLERMLINAVDMTNQKTMIALANRVYPYYQKIKAKDGLTAVKHHLDYVHQHITDWNRHTNIAKYLEKAVKDYVRKH